MERNDHIELIKMLRYPYLLSPLMTMSLLEQAADAIERLLQESDRK